MENKQFPEFLSDLFLKCKFDRFTIKKLLSDSNILIFKQAFTTNEIDPDFNYEWIEQLGDSFHRAWLVNYLYFKFPNLQSKNGVRIVSDLVKKYGAKEEMAKMARSLDFFHYICANPETKHQNSTRLLEDVFEAFIGACKICGDTISPCGYKYVVCRFLDAVYSKTIFDINNLRDAKSILKEMIDKSAKLKTDLHVEYIDLKSKEAGFLVKHVFQDIVIGENQDYKKNSAEKNAAAQAIKWLHMNWRKWSQEDPKELVWQSLPQTKSRSRSRSRSKNKEAEIYKLLQDIKI